MGAPGLHPRLYSVEDVAEAAIVRAVLGRGVPHSEVRRAVLRLRMRSHPPEPWPLNAARLATVRGEDTRARLLLFEGGTWMELGRRGWQATSTPEDLDPIELRLSRS